MDAPQLPADATPDDWESQYDACHGPTKKKYLRAGGHAPAFPAELRKAS